MTLRLVVAVVGVTVMSTLLGAGGRLERHASLPWASPDGQYVAFESSREDDHLQIYVMRIDGTGVRRLTRSASIDVDPIWSPDGKWIMFRSFATPQSEALDIVRIDGTGRHTIVSAKSIGWPRISPDGKRVAFQSSDKNGKAEIVTLKINGTDPQPVPTGLDRPWDPAWSPDGKHLVFAQQPPDEEDPNTVTESVYISDVSGSNRRLLATFQGFIQLPAWSPDGKTIAYQTWTAKRGDADIVLLDVATGTFSSITHRDRPYLDETPAWLPDGRLLFQSTRDGRYEIYSMNKDGSDQQRLTR
jgi:Tol biopolymer transport system component